MPCANAVARSCVRPVANAVDAIAGLSRPPGSLIYSDFMGGLGGADPLLGYLLPGAQYQDGVLVGLQPACDDLAFAGLPGVRGMRTEGQITNILPAGSEDFRLWTKEALNSVTLSYTGMYAVVVGAGTSIVSRVSKVVPVVVGSVTFRVRLKSISGVRWIRILSAGATVSTVQGWVDIVNWEVGTNNGVTLSISSVYEDGSRDVLVTFSATSSANSTVFVQAVEAEIGYNGTFSGSESFLCGFPMLSATAYPVPYVPSGTTQTSTAHNGTSGIHYAMPQNGPIWNQLSTAKPLTLAARVVMGVGSAKLPVCNVPLFSVIPSPLLYLDNPSLGRVARSSDGTSSPAVTGEWLAYEQLVIAMQVNTAGTQFRVGVYRVAAKTWSWSSWAAYDGSFNPSTVYQKLMIAFGNNYPMWHIRHWLADYQSSEADILAAMGGA